MPDFWSLIDQARESNSPLTPSADPARLKAALEPLSDAEVAAFSAEFYRKLIDLNRWSLWAAGYVLAGGMGDDEFHYFRSWIIGKGKACFTQALSDPAGLLPYLDTREIDNELLEYVAIEVLEARGVEDDPRDEIEEDADGEPSGEPFDEDTVDNLYPTLALPG